MNNETEESEKPTDMFAPGENPYAYRCHGTFNPHDLSTAPPHGTQDCGCPRYKGDGRSLCHNRFYDPGHDLTGTGPGTPNRICGHPPEHHYDDR
jgi:hypothetical protein